MGMIVLADAMSIPVKSSSVQCVVTSPPYYGLRDYGIDGQIGLELTVEEYVDKMVAVFREVRRVLRDDGTCWVNLGDSYAGSTQSGGKNGLNGTPKNSEKHYGIHKNLSGSLKPKDLIGVPWRVAFALQADGWYLRQDIIWHKPNPMPESVTDRCTKAHEYIFLLTKSARYYFDNDAIREPQVDFERGNRNPSDKYGGNRVPGRESEQFIAGWRKKEESYNPAGRNRRSVWTITTKPFKEAHFATFPPEIPEICIKAGSKSGDTILDPFAGSGTTGVVAEKLGRKFIGLDISEQYCNMANNRIYAACGGLF
jgi:DNA modification methylase